MLNKKLSVLISVLATSTVFAYSVRAQSVETYPSKAIVVVLGFPAGSGADIICRFFADQISTIAGQRLLIENRVGAFSAIAMANVGSAKPDGYKILWTGSSVMAGGRHMVKQMPNDPQKDFVPVGAFAEFPFVLVTGKKNSTGSLAEFIQDLKAKPRVLFGHFNPPGLLATAYFNSRIGIKADPVSYKGAASALPELENGTLDFMVMDAAFAIGPIKSGRIRAFAVTNDTRSPQLPDIPTMLEAGLGSFEFTPWFGAWFPTGTPTPIVDRFSGWLQTVAKNPNTAAFLEKFAVLPLAGGPEMVRSRIAADTLLWDKFAREAGITPQ